MTDLHRHQSLFCRLSQSWQQRRFLKRYLTGCLHPKQVQLFFDSLFSSHHYLQETRYKRRLLSTLPVCFIIGAHHSGKSSLIENSGLATRAGEGLNSRYQPIAARNMPQFRHNSTKLFIELPAYLFINESVKHIPYLTHTITFLVFFDYLTKTREILYTISLEDLLTDTEHQQRQFNEFFASLTVFLTAFPVAINVHLVISKVDRILGFSEFFDDLSFEERQLPCGIGLSLPSNALHNQKQFHLLVRRLTERLFWRCHSEHQLQRRLLVADFPQQFLAQEQGLANYWQRLAEIQEETPHVRFKSLHWLSNAQSGKLIDLLRGQAINLMQLPITHCLPLLVQRKTYFVRGFFQYLHVNGLERTKKSFVKALRPKIPTIPPVTNPKNLLPAVNKARHLSKRASCLLGIILMVIVLSATVTYSVYNHVLNARPLLSLQQNPALAYALVTANNPTQALSAYISHVSPQLSFRQQQAMVTDPDFNQQLLKTASTYVNQAWQEQVREFYSQNIANHYPLDATAKNEVTLKNFGVFYGPAGIIDQFSKHYLDDFLKHYPVKLTPGAKQLLTNVKSLQANLFNSTGNINITFSLSLSQLNARVKQLDLQIAGTDFSAKAHTLISKNFSWPNLSGLNTSGYSIQLRVGPTQNQTYPGIWSWLQVLGQFHSNDFSKDNNGTYTGNFFLNDDSIQLALTSQQNIAVLLPLFTQLTVPTTIL